MDQTAFGETSTETVIAEFQMAEKELPIPRLVASGTGPEGVGYRRRGCRRSSLVKTGGVECHPWGQWESHDAQWILYQASPMSAAYTWVPYHRCFSGGISSF